MKESHCTLPTDHYNPQTTERTHMKESPCALKATPPTKLQEDI